MQGSCLCEKVSFEVRGDLPGFYQCHCTKCRQVTGSSNNTGTLVNNDQFHWLSGEDLVRLYVKDSGYHSAFCSCCGSAMPNTLRDGSGYWIPAGALGACDSEVTANLFVADKASWNKIGNAGTQYDAMPTVAELKLKLNADTAGQSDS